MRQRFFTGSTRMRRPPVRRSATATSTTSSGALSAGWPLGHRQAGGQAAALLRRPLDIYRSKIEAQALQLESRLAPDYIPEVYHYDETMAALSMEDISAYRNLRKELRRAGYTAISRRTSPPSGPVPAAHHGSGAGPQEKKRRCSSSPIRSCATSRRIWCSRNRTGTQGPQHRYPRQRGLCAGPSL